ncbi:MULTISPECIES: DUF72 domain-containing protein [Sphingomonas]|uniref:DUF72 domain-containing protein n=1 Tax=Sphingomonas TaxID=13687 RepID=UPI000F7DB343|nr:DUF72 domain-containing protein [Sphingomonas sp. ABOLF]RSV15496.1 DUF72 domain-containing protein [Sphingomonas sp. ABOLF]GLK22451.1 hypothetical protein GCM10017606_32790 [Microbacterium terregens]
MRLRIGTAGWSIPREAAGVVPGEGTHLQRYARRLDAAEINSSFHRPHRSSTYARWAASVPPHFRFSVKLPKTITHQHKLAGCGDLLGRFADEVAGLGSNRGPTLVQLPPSLAFEPAVATAFFTELAARLGPAIVCEPRHPSWFEEAAERLLRDHAVSRVAADPAVHPRAAEPGGWAGLAYFRLHGSPVIYRSSYDAGAIARLHDAMAAAGTTAAECWTIFDNTASGAALANALQLIESFGSEEDRVDGLGRNHLG